MREFIQTKLNEIDDIDIGAEIPDDMLEENVTYFSYSLSKTFLNGDHDNNFSNRVNCIGFVKRLIKSEENTLEIVDNATDKIIDKLKEINIRCSSEDVSISNNVQKIKIIGYGTYNEINNRLV